MSVTAANITKTLTSGETIASATAQGPKLTIANSTTQSLYGGILEFNKSGTTTALDNPAVGTIQGTDENGAYAKMDLIMETRGNGNQNGAISFSVMQSGSYKQLLDINKENANTVSIGTADDPANLKVFGSMLLETTSFEKSILPGARGVQNIGSNSLTPDESGVTGLYEWGNIYLAEGGQISIGGSAAQPDNALDVTLTQVMSNAGDRGLLLNVDNKLYFEDDNVSTGLDQFIGSSGGGTTLMSSPQLDIAASSTLNLTSSGSVAFTSATTTDINSGGNLTLTTPAASKLIFNTNTAGTISHTSDLATEDLTIEQLGAVDASLIISSAGTGVDAIAISASAGGIDITATGTVDTEDLDITTVGTTTELRLTSASTEADAIKLDASAGGIIAKVFDEKTLQLSNAGNDTYIKLNASGTAVNETIQIMNAVGTASSAIAFTSSAGGVDINAGAGVTVDGTGISIDGTTASNFTVTGEGSNLALAAAGGGTQQLVLSSAGTDAQAINIDASAGGIDIDADGDITMNATNITITPTTLTTNIGDMTVQGTNDNNAELYLYADNGDDPGDKWLVKAEGVSASAEFSIGHFASGGWISYLTLGADKKITAPFGFAGDMASDENVSDNVMTIQSNSSANEALILNAPNGGITINAAADKDVSITGGQVALASEHNIGEAISLTTNVGPLETIVVTNTLGTAAGAIKLDATVGGIDIDAAGQVNIASTKDDAAAIVLSTTQGGIDILATGVAADDIDITGTLTSVVIGSSEEVADAIKLNASGSASGIVVNAGTNGVNVDATGEVNIASSKDDPTAVVVTASAGGIDITATGAAAGDDIDITATGSSVNIQSTEDITNAVVISTTQGGIDILATGVADDDIDITGTLTSVNISSTEDVADAVVITSTVGGIDILAAGAAAGEDIDIIATGSSVNIESTEETTGSRKAVSDCQYHRQRHCNSQSNGPATVRPFRRCDPHCKLA